MIQNVEGEGNTPHPNMCLPYPTNWKKMEGNKFHPAGLDHTDKYSKICKHTPLLCNSKKPGGDYIYLKRYACRIKTRRVNRVVFGVSNHRVNSE